MQKKTPFYCEMNFHQLATLYTCKWKKHTYRADRIPGLLIGGIQVLFGSINGMLYCNPGLGNFLTSFCINQDGIPGEEGVRDGVS